ncbi:hypothetical protein EG329_000427 [Mollisiaceae sp. DMI_Dod_QoI]|nr:hypothetical protein EG329_000427 [Helotiales sp. DMI_Dod_QoI]
MTSKNSTHLTCLCGAISEPASLLNGPEFPITTSICHCNPCRQTTGSLGVSFPPLTSSPSAVTLSKLAAYHSSDILTRYFCPTCGCHCFLFHHQWNRWYCLGGIIEPNPSSQTKDVPGLKDTIKVSLHEYVLDTIDGGLTPLLLSLGDRSIPTWSAAPKQGPFDLLHDTVHSLSRKSIDAISTPKEDSYLPAKCHCGGVSLLIKRANYTSSANSDVSARYIPSDPTKWLSYFCACRSCRLSFGVSLTPWALVLPSHVFNAKTPAAIDDPSLVNNKNNPLPVTFGRLACSPEANPGQTLKHHWSSPDVCRSFCGKCGASVSYWCEKRPDELDFAVGILRSEEGSMARGWLEWVWGKCSSDEESIDREISEAWMGSAEKEKKLNG